MVEEIEAKRKEYFRASSNFILGIVLLEVVKALSTGFGDLGKEVLVIEILSIGALLFTCIQIRYGKTWVKYIVLLFTIFYILGLLLLIGHEELYSLAAALTLIQIIMAVWILVLLFTLPKPIDKSLLDHEI